MKEKLKSLILKIKNSLLRVFVFGKGNTTIKVLAPIALVLVFVLVPMQVAHAGLFDWAVDGAKGAILWFIGWIIGDIFIPLMGAIMIWITKGIVMVAGYNGFGTATAVTVGWVLLRDMANMIFVIALLMMAFGTMLDIESLGNSKQLPRLLVMAVAVNFSKMLTLFLIDISQVVMLTFVAAFRATAAGNFVKAFGITDWFTKVGQSSDAQEQFTETLIAMLLAAILTVVATGVLIVFLSFLVIRMVTLWMLIIFSPLAFGLSVLAKKGKSYYDKWWDELVKTLITGPLIAFFLWLTLATAGASAGIGTEIITNSRNVSETLSDVGSGSGAISASPTGQHGTKAFQLDVLITFVVSIAMLMLGLQITQEVGAAGIGKAMAARGQALSLAKKGMKYGYRGAKFAAQRAPIIPARDSEGKLRFGTVAGATVGALGALGIKVGDERKKAQEQAAREREAKQAELFGGADGILKAKRIRSGNVKQEREKFAGVPAKDIENRMQQLAANGKQGTLEHKAAALELASKGFFNNKHGEIDNVAGLDSDFKNELISAANEKGAGILKVEGGDARKAVRALLSDPKTSTRDVYSRLDQQSMQYRDSKGNISTGDPYASAKFMEIDEEEFKKPKGSKFDSQMKKAVRRGGLNMIANAKNQQERAELVDKFNKLHPGSSIALDATGVVDTSTMDPGDFATQKEMQNEQQNNITKTDTDELRKKQGNVSPADSTLINSAGLNMDATNKARLRRTASDLQRLTSDLSTPAKIYDADTSTDVYENELRNQFRSLDIANKKTGVTDKDGNELSHAQMFDTSALKTTIGTMRKKLQELQDPATTSERKSAIQKEIVSMQNLINAVTQQMLSGGRGNTEGGRKTYEKIVTKKAPKMDARISSYMGNAKSETNAVEKVKQMTLARREMEKSVKELTKKDLGLASAVKSELQKLKADIAKFNMADTSKTIAQKLDELKQLHNEYEKLRKTT